ncbi:insulinase family protein [Sphingomonas koreensis]|uniref:M16 family metallopeptidase n=1 Tax=Sphingomonas koreensis TaxID=93064 RepID=UPI0008300D78|nr:M16 family metallopeptidase [Sphingomonas koreensis]PJI88200.1 zinc protease [Sphingomonas koreensis]RSU59357.1 insulinase family protein [Sphingomonas koreensis]RSU64534.1 insulinase family protein [Sphingomonas koreensis]
MALFPRVKQLALPLLVAAAAIPAIAQVAAPAPVAAPVAVDKAPWLYKGSDVPHDPEWRFGTLPNGLRYAVRKNGVPPGQVSIRLRMDVGSLMERESEKGFAHLLEHLSFRGSAKVPDGESKREWQRLGVTFGSDSNASTTPVSTTYKLDLPDANETSLDKSMMILADMMAAPNITTAMLNLERPVVLAEQRERLRPQQRFEDAQRELFYAGQLFAERPVIGTVETLNGATADSVRAFHQRWYRPERATLVIVGDLDPALFETQIAKHFAAWRGTGPNPVTPDFGKPDPAKPTSAALVEPTLPPYVTLAVLRPWTVFQDTVKFNQERMIDFIALRIINRRLESRARAGANFAGAGADLSDDVRSANVTAIQVLPLGEDWESAVKEVRAVIADALATAPTQAEIDREVAEIDSGMRNSVSTAPVMAGSRRADNLVEAVDINEVTTSEQESYNIFKGAVDGRMFTPDRVLASTRRILQGDATRAVINTRTADPDVQAKLAAVLKADVSGLAGTRSTARNVTFASLPALGAPGKVAERTIAVADPKIETVRFANGVNLILFQNPGEVGRVYVNVRFGRGMQGIPSGRQTPAWAGGMALVASGISAPGGTLGQEELDKLTGDRQIGLSFGIGDDAFTFAGQTRKEDLEDQLKLIAAKLQSPGWDPKPVARARAVSISGYASSSSSPDAVIGRDLERLLHDNDPRWGMPDLKGIEALNAKDFRAFWAPLLASGPIEVQIFGDIDVEKAVEAARVTFGAMKPRKATPPVAAAMRFPQNVVKPVQLTHSGQPDQAAAVIAWQAGGGSDNIAEGRKLEILAAVMRDRILDRIRSAEGASYSPTVISQWPVGQPGGGRIMAITLIPPDKTDLFFRVSREIAADLIARPIDTDELRRALVPTAQMVVRRSSGNPFWMQQTEGGTFDPKRFAAIGSIARDYGATTPQELQMLAAKYLAPQKDWSMVVVPETKPAAATAAGGR